MCVRTVKIVVKLIKVYNVNVVKKEKKLDIQKGKKTNHIMVVISEIPTLSFGNLMKEKTRIHLRR